MHYNPPPRKCKADDPVTILLLSYDQLPDSPRFTDVHTVSSSLGGGLPTHETRENDGTDRNRNHLQEESESV